MPCLTLIRESREKSDGSDYNYFNIGSHNTIKAINLIPFIGKELTFTKNGQGHIPISKTISGRGSVTKTERLFNTKWPIFKNDRYFIPKWPILITKMTVIRKYLILKWLLSFKANIRSLCYQIFNKMTDTLSKWTLFKNIQYNNLIIHPNSLPLLLYRKPIASRVD